MVIVLEVLAQKHFFFFVSMFVCIFECRYARLDPIDRHWNVDIYASWNDATSWNCQLFRSITSDSVCFDPRLENSGSLNAKKGRSFEASICKVKNQML